MNPKKLKVIAILSTTLLLILIVLVVIIDSFSNRNEEKNYSENAENTTENSIYNFNETIDLDNESPLSSDVLEIGTENDDMGTISSYYDSESVRYEGGKIFLPSSDGEDVISREWENTGYAKYINEPKFGEIEKFILSEDSISASYTETTMKDVISYINELSGVGFTNVITNNKNNRYDFYNYSAQNGEITVTLKYEKGRLVIMVY